MVQTRAQLRRLNGGDGAEEIIGNCDAQVVYTPGTLKDVKEISERLGTHGQSARSKTGRSLVFEQQQQRRNPSSHAP